MNNLTAQIEALLFIHGEPMDLKSIVKTLADADKNINEEAVKAALLELTQDYENSSRGLRLISGGDKFQLATKPEMSSLFEKLAKEELNEELTPAALETLAVIAYAAPVSRHIIDYVRGVNSTFILRTLLLRGLIERIPDPKRPNAYIYKPSFEMIKHLGFQKIEDLPEYAKFKGVIEKLKN